MASPAKKHPLKFYGCSFVAEDYTILEKLGEGTFGEVHKATHRPSGKPVALKKIFVHNEKEGFPLTALREIRILKDLRHENVIPLVDMTVQRGDRQTKTRSSIYMVTPYMDHDLSGLLQNPSVRLTLPQIKCYMKQLLEGMSFIHDQRYLHRDIKSANILIDNHGIVKIADFGLARKYFEDPPGVGSGVGPGKHRYTTMVVTRWYRPPELILGETMYTTAIDMWGIGCVFGEMFKKNPILQGNSDTDQGNRIFQLVGSPTEETMPGYDRLPGAANFKFGPYRRQLESVFRELNPQAMSLLSGLLVLNPQSRLTSVGALAHAFFYTDPPAALPQELPKYPESHEMENRNNKHKNVPHAPNVDNAQHPHNSQYQQPDFSTRSFDSRNNNINNNNNNTNNNYQPYYNKPPPAPPYREDRYDYRYDNRGGRDFHYHDYDSRDRRYDGRYDNYRNDRNDRHDNRHDNRHYRQNNYYRHPPRERDRPHPNQQSQPVEDFDSIPPYRKNNATLNYGDEGSSLKRRRY